MGPQVGVGGARLHAPDWVAEAAVGEPKAVTIASKILKAELPALIWAHPDATERSPLLVAHDGPEYAQHSALLTYLGRLPPLARR